MSGSLLSMQRTAGNRATAMLVQRQFPKPQMPANPMALSPHLTRWKDPTYAYEALKMYYKEGGKERVDGIVKSLEQEAQAFLPDDRRAVMDNARLQQERLVLYIERFVVTFESQAQQEVRTMLDASEQLIKQEMTRYGISEDLEVEGNTIRGTGEYTVHSNDQSAQLAETAKLLVEKGENCINLELKLKAEFDRQSAHGPLDQEHTRQQERHILKSEEYVKARGEYEALFMGAAAKFPILAAFRDNPLGIAALANEGKNPAAATVIGKELAERLKNIDETRKNLGGKLKVLSLPNVVEATKKKMNLAADSVEAKAVAQTVSQRQSDEALRKLALAALGISFGLLAAFASGGATLVAAGMYGASAGAAAGVSLLQLAKSVEEYQVQSAAAGTDLDKARAVSQSDPSLLWLASTWWPR